jgi:hypothetical protein
MRAFRRRLRQRLARRLAVAMRDALLPAQDGDLRAQIPVPRQIAIR